MQVGESFWKEKQRIPAPALKVAAHQCIVAHKSPYFEAFFRERGGAKLGEPLVVDFGGQVCYEAFRKIIDFIYLDDHQWLMDSTASRQSSSTEMIEIIKLAKQYKLDGLSKACETHFKELMVQSFDCTNLLTLKTGRSSSPIPGSQSSIKRNKNTPIEGQQ